MLRNEEIFVGREEEIGDFFEFLDGKGSAFVVIGEPGIGKSSFLKEVVRRIRTESKDRGVFVGFHPVLDGTTNVASPFVMVLDDLMANLSVPPIEKVEEGVKRAKSVVGKIFSERGRHLAKSMVKSFAIKHLGTEIVEELEKAYEEWKSTRSIESLAEEMFLDRRDEFVYDFIFFFEKLVEAYEKMEFVLVIDQFERAPLVSCKILLGFVRAKPERVHVAVSFKVEKEGVVKYESIKADLLQLNVRFLRLPSLSVEEIGEWILKAKGKEFSHPELRRIRSLSGGFPFLIDNWLKYSKELQLDELRVGREGYCQFVEWCFEGLSDKCSLFLRRISVLLQPLSVRDYERLTDVKTGECSLLLKELEKNWILMRQGGTFWFRHDLIKPCIERKLSDSERKRYHLDAAKFFEADFDSSLKAGKRVEFHVGLGCCYHFHNAEQYEKSLMYNSQFASFCFSTGSLYIAEECYLRAIDAAEQLGDKSSLMVTKGNLARVYQIWGRIDEAYILHQELLEYFGKEKDYGNQATALHQLAMIEEDKGDYDEALNLYEQSLKIRRKIADKSGIAKSLHQLANIHYLLGDYGKAKELYSQSLKIKQELGDKLGIAKTLHQLANIEYSHGNTEKTKELYAQTLRIKQELGDRLGIAKTLHQLAMVSEDAGNYDEAEELYNESLEIKKALGDKQDIARTLVGLARISEKRRKFDLAIRLYEEALRMYRQLRDDVRTVEELRQLGRLYSFLEEYEKAEMEYSAAIQTLEKMGDVQSIVQLRQDLRETQLKAREKRQKV